jgi:hypothetical protein
MSPANGTIVKDSRGEPTGALKEAAMALMTAAAPKPTRKIASPRPAPRSTRRIASASPACRTPAAPPPISICSIAFANARS